VASVVSSAVVLLAAWEFGAATATAPPGTLGGSAQSGDTTAGGSSSAGASEPAASSVVDGTYTGNVVSTRYGDAQVAVTISGGQITDVAPLALPSRDGRSEQISTAAEPILKDEVLAAQSADVSIVSRATYTSEGYLQSLQSALQDAGW
jgi:uncharacterized protein with FMN-binding domain